MFENDLILIFSWNIHIFTIMIGTSYVSNWCCQLWEKAVVSETVAHEISEHFVTIICKKYLRYSPVFNIQYRCTCNWIHSTIAVFHILSYNPLHLRCEPTKFVIKAGFPFRYLRILAMQCLNVMTMRHLFVFTCSRASECLAPVRARVWQTKAWKNSGAEQVTSKQG